MKGQYSTITRVGCDYNVTLAGPGPEILPLDQYLKEGHNICVWQLVKLLVHKLVTQMGGKCLHGGNYPLPPPSLPLLPSILPLPPDLTLPEYLYVSRISNGISASPMDATLWSRQDWLQVHCLSIRYDHLPNKFVLHISSFGPKFS